MAAGKETDCCSHYSTKGESAAFVHEARGSVASSVDISYVKPSMFYETLIME
jgi:hypothetical protein